MNGYLNILVTYTYTNCGEQFLLRIGDNMCEGRMTEHQSHKVTSELVLKILFYATVLATFIFFLNFAVFQLLDIFVRTGIFWNFYWIVPLEGLVMAIAAVLNLTYIGDLTRRFPTWRSPFQELIHADEMRLGRHIVASIIALAGLLLFGVGFLLLSQAGF